MRRLLITANYLLCQYCIMRYLGLAMHEGQPAGKPAGQAVPPAEAARQAGQELGLGELLNVHVKHRNPPLLCCLGTLLCLLFRWAFW